ncbi:MAG: hypothetical protein AVDCRST_MAG11-871, partial [uncultured Gemmatimonadaceae bacterium]
DRRGVVRRLGERPPYDSRGRGGLRRARARAPRVGQADAVEAQRVRLRRDRGARLDAGDHPRLEGPGVRAGAGGVRGARRRAVRRDVGAGPVAARARGRQERPGSPVLPWWVPGAGAAPRARDRGRGARGGARLGGGWAGRRRGGGARDRRHDRGSAACARRRDVDADRGSRVPARRV